MDKLTYPQKRKIGLKLYEFLYSFTSEGSHKFDTKYPDYDKFRLMPENSFDAPIRYMQKIMDGEQCSK